MADQANDDQVGDSLRALPAKLRRALSEVVRSQAELLADAIRDAAPEGETGLLRGSVAVRSTSDPLTFVVTAGGDETTKQVREGSGVAYDYALALEFGTRHAAAQPFFYPTCDEMRDEIAEAIQRGVVDALGRG